MDNSGGFTRALANWLFGSRRRWTDPSSISDCADCFDYQSRVGPKSYLALPLISIIQFPAREPAVSLSGGRSIDILNRRMNPVLTRVGGNASALSTASSASSGIGGALLDVGFKAKEKRRGS